jgi:hypothetical protein
MRARNIILPAACLVTGLLIGFGSNRVHSHVRPTPSSPVSIASSLRAPLCPPPVQGAPSGQISLSDIRTVIREELRTELAGYGAQPKESREDRPEPDAATIEKRRMVYEEANSQLQNAIRYGTWTGEDRQRLRGVLHELSVAQQDQLIGDLFGAIQNGRLKVEDSGTPL